LRIVVFSDSHNNFFALKNIVRSRIAADYFIHLGDGAKDFEALVQVYPSKIMYNVRGNCDWSSMEPNQGILMCAGKKIFYTHGHIFHVKSGLEELKAHARELDAQIVLFGHTHIACTEYDNGLYLMNPGSVTSPLYGSPSYGMLDITKAGVAMNIVHM